MDLYFEDLLEDDDEVLHDRVTAILMDGWRLDREVAHLWRETPYQTSEGYARVALDDEGYIVGWLGAERTHPRGWQLVPVAVRADRRRQGVGRALIEDLVAILAEDPPTTLHVALPGDDVVPFYLRLGFAPVGRLPGVLGPGRDEVLLARVIG